VERNRLSGLENIRQARLKSSDNRSVQEALQTELERLKNILGLGYEVQVQWHPGQARLVKGRRVDEYVDGDVINIYCVDPHRAHELLRHGFMEWLGNRLTRPYRILLNKIIEAYEDVQYTVKEEVVDALAGLLLKASRNETKRRRPPKK